MDFRAPKQTKYSPPNIEALQKQFMKHAGQLIRLMEGVLYLNARKNSLPYAREIHVEDILLKLMRNEQVWPRASLRAHNRIIDKLTNLRRSIISHPIHSLPHEIIQLILWYTPSGTFHDMIFIIPRVCRLWEDLAFKHGALWADYFAVDQENAKYRDLSNLLANYNNHKQPCRVMTIDDSCSPALLDQFVTQEMMDDLHALYCMKEARLFIESDSEGVQLDIPSVKPCRRLPNTIETLHIARLSGLDLFLKSFITLNEIHTLTLKSLIKHNLVVPKQLCGMPSLRNLELCSSFSWEFLLAVSIPNITKLLVHIPSGKGYYDALRAGLYFGFDATSLRSMELRPCQMMTVPFSNESLAGLMTKHRSTDIKIDSYYRDIPYLEYLKDSKLLLPRMFGHEPLFPYTQIGLVSSLATPEHSIFLPRTTKLRLRVKGMGEANVYLSGIIAPQLRHLIILLDMFFSYNLVREHYNLSMFSKLEILHIMRPSDDLGTISICTNWSSLKELIIPVNDLIATCRGTAAMFSELRVLHLTGEIDSSRDTSYLYIWPCINWSKLRSLRLPSSFRILPTVPYEKAEALESIHFGGSVSESGHHDLVKTLWENPSVCPALETVTFNFMPANLAFHSIILFRAQASLLGLPVSPISIATIDSQPSPGVWERAKAVMEGKLYDNTI